MSLEKIIKFNFNLLLLLPVALISGPMISDFIVILSCLLFFFYFKFFSIEIFKTKNIYALFFLWLLSSLSSFFSTDFFFSIKSSLFYVRIIVFSLAVYSVFLFNEKKLNLFFYIILSIFIILFIDSNFQKYFGYNLVGIELSNNVRISSFFGNELIL